MVNTILATESAVARKLAGGELRQTTSRSHESLSPIFATTADCANSHVTECQIGVASLVFANFGFAFRGVGAAGYAADDVVKAVNWFSQVGAGGFTVGGVMSSLFGVPAP